jgi:hypothetical protein
LSYRSEENKAEADLSDDAFLRRCSTGEFDDAAEACGLTAPRHTSILRRS